MDSVSVMRSGSYLLFTFLGGATFFFGPIIGAVLLVLASVLLSELTKAWLLYLGLVFLLMVMYAPGGVASLIMMNLRVARFGKWRRLAQPYLAIAASALVMIVGGAAIVEMIYHLQLNAALGPQVSFMGVQLDTSSASTWTVAVAIFVVGLGLLEVARRWCLRRWERIQEEIEEAIKRGRVEPCPALQSNVRAPRPPPRLARPPMRWSCATCTSASARPRSSVAPSWP